MRQAVLFRASGGVSGEFGLGHLGLRSLHMAHLPGGHFAGLRKEIRGGGFSVYLHLQNTYCR